MRYNNPLQAVQICLHLAGREDLPEEKRKEYFDLARTELERLMLTAFAACWILGHSQYTFHPVFCQNKQCKRSGSFRRKQCRILDHTMARKFYHDLIAKVTNDPTWRKYIEDAGADAVFYKEEKFKELVKEDLKDFIDILKELGAAKPK